MTYQVLTDVDPRCSKIAIRIIVDGYLAFKPWVIPKEFDWIVSALTHAYTHGRLDEALTK